MIELCPFPTPPTTISPIVPTAPRGDESSRMIAQVHNPMMTVVSTSTPMGAYTTYREPPRDGSDTASDNQLPPTDGDGYSGSMASTTELYEYLSRLTLDDKEHAVEEMAPCPHDTGNHVNVEQAPEESSPNAEHVAVEMAPDPLENENHVNLEQVPEETSPDAHENGEGANPEHEQARCTGRSRRPRMYDRCEV